MNKTEALVATIVIIGFLVGIAWATRILTDLFGELGHVPVGIVLAFILWWSFLED